jgi:O-antigen ligase
MSCLVRIRENSYGWIAILTAFFLPLSTSLTNILFIACAVCFLLSGRYLENLHFIWGRKALFLSVVLFGWMLVGISYTTAPFSEAFSALIKYDKLLLGLFFVPIFREEKWRNYALHAFFIAMVVMLAAGLFKEISWPTLGEKFGHFLVFKDRIQTSFLMAMAAYFSGIFFFETKEKLSRWLYALLFIVTLFFLFSIDGRSGYFVFFALFVWLLWSYRRWKGVAGAIIAIMAMLCMAYLFSPAFNARLQESVHDAHVYQTGEKNTSLGLRAEFNKHSVELVKKHPLIGTGTGSFTVQYASLEMPENLKTTNPHNQYMHILVQWGVVGLALLLWLFFVQWKDSYLLSPKMRQIAQGTLLAIAIGSLANSWLLDTTEGHFYVYFMALVFASQIKLKPTPARHPPVSRHPDVQEE